LARDACVRRNRFSLLLDADGRATLEIQRKSKSFVAGQVYTIIAKM
jgi:hypothetical protein